MKKIIVHVGFIGCVAFGHNAEFATTDIVVEEQEFAESKAVAVRNGQSGNYNRPAVKAEESGFKK